MRYYSVPVLNVLVTTSRLHPADQVAINVTLLTALTSEKYINYTATTPKQEELERFLLPLCTKSLAANAKVSLILEQIVMYMMDRDLLQPNENLRSAMEIGIKERSTAKGKKTNLEEEEQGEALLEMSSERLRGLLAVLDTAVGNMPIRESLRKKSMSSFTSGFVSTCKTHHS